MRTRISIPVEHPLRSALSRRVLLMKIGVSNMGVSAMTATALVALVACSAAAPPKAVAGGGKTPMAQAATSGSKSGDSKPAGKISAEMAGKLSPIPAMMASGEDWTFEMRGTQGMEHHASLLFQGGAKRLEGTVTYRETNEHAGVRWMRFDGTLRNERGDAAFAMTVGEQACKGRDGRQLGHTVRFVLGRTEYAGCADVAMY
jgi:hypothetical protein